MTRSFILNSIVPSIFATSLCLYSSSTTAVSLEEQSFQFNFGAQPLSQALLQFSKLTKIAFLSQGDILKRKRAPAIRGVFTAQEFLDLLLMGTDLSYQFYDANRILIAKVLAETAARINAASDPISVMDSLGTVSLNAVYVADWEEFSPEGIDEIYVTAARRRQSLQNVAASVRVISPEDFIFRGFHGIRDILNYTPGLDFTEGVGAPGAGTIIARGIPQASATPVFSMYLDDTPLTSNTSFSNGAGIILDALFFDIERIEFIKGPQGTLFGASSVGGVLRYITRDPSLDDVRAIASVDFSTTKGGGISQFVVSRISTPIIVDILGVTATVSYRDAAGYLDFIEEDGSLIEENIELGDVHGYSLDVYYKPSDDLQFRFKYLNQKNRSRGGSRARLEGPDSSKGFLNGFNVIDTPNLYGLDYEIFSVNLTYEFESFTFSGTSSFSEYSITTESDITSAFSDFIDTDLDEDRGKGFTSSVTFISSSGARKHTQEFKLTSSDNSVFEWIAGLYYAEEKTNNVQKSVVVPFFDLISADFPSEYTELAGFGDATYYFSENFDVTAGFRLSQNNVSLSVNTSGILAGGVQIEDQALNDTVETYLFSARYRATPNLSLYVRAANGYRPAQANIPVFDPDTNVNIASAIVDADSAWTYEIGAKGRFWQDIVEFDISAWKIDWSKYQAYLVLNAVSTGGNVDNGLTAYGLEVTSTIRPVSGLSVVGNMSYTKSTLIGDEPLIGGVEGEDYPALPNWKASLQWDYFFSVSSNWSASFGGGIRYIGSFHSSFEQSVNAIDVDVAGHVLSDLNFYLRDGTYNIGVYVTNVFNNASLLDRFDGVVGDVVTSKGTFTQPRVIGVNFRVEF